MSQTCYDWDLANFDWDNNDFTWDDVCLTLEVVDDGNGGIDTNKWKNNYKKLSKEEQNDFVKLVVRVKNKVANVYGNPIIEKKDIKNFNITTQDIKLVIKQVLRITIQEED